MFDPAAIAGLAAPVAAGLGALQIAGVHLDREAGLRYLELHSKVESIKEIVWEGESRIHIELRHRLPDYQVAGYIDHVVGTSHLEAVLGFEAVGVSEPDPFIDGPIGFMISGEGIHAAPRAMGAHEIQWSEFGGDYTDVMTFPTSTVADQTCRWMAVVITFGETDSEALEIAGRPRFLHLPKRDFLYELAPLEMRDEFERWVRFHTTSPRDAYHGWEFTREPGGSGDQPYFGHDPEPQVRWGNMHSADLLWSKLLRVQGCYPMTVDAPHYTPTPDPDAHLFFGSLSDHSRNRLGRPDRWDPRLPEFKRHRHGWYAPDPQHATNLTPLLAWYTGCPWAIAQTKRLVYWIMNSIHDPEIPIYAGGYRSALMPHHRATGRLLRLSIQCMLVLERYDPGVSAELFDFWEDRLQDIIDIWRPLGYGDWEDVNRPDGHVEGMPAIPVWELGYLIPPLVWWEANHSTATASTILDDLAELMIRYGWIEEGGKLKAWKLIKADDPSRGRWLDARHDGQTSRHYGAIVLLRGRIGLLEPKRQAIQDELERQYPGIASDRFGMVGVKTPTDCEPF